MMERSEWLAERRKSIGGSDAAAIVGLNDYASPYSVWADKTGRLPEKEDTESMRQGRDLEQYVADRWMEATGKKCRRRTQILRNRDYPFAHANVDRWVVGEKAGLECKTTRSLNLKQFQNGEFPDHYYVQCVHYMAVTGAERWYLAVLVLGTGFYTYTIERDEDEIAALMDTEWRFWTYVEKDTPPPTDGTEATADALKAIYKGGDTKGDVDLFGLKDALDRYTAAKQSIKELELAARTAENEIKEYMGDSEVGRCGQILVTWKRQTRKNFNKLLFEAAHPEIDLSRYYKNSISRPFKIKEQT